MNDFAALFGDLGAGIKDELKVYVPLTAGAVAGLLLWNKVVEMGRGYLPASISSSKWVPVGVSAAEIAAGVAAPKYLGRFLSKLPGGGFITQGLTIGLIADGLLGFVGSVGAALSLPIPKVIPTKFLGDSQDVLFQRYLAGMGAAPVSVEQLKGMGAAPVSVELAGAGVASTLTA